MARSAVVPFKARVLADAMQPAARSDPQLAAVSLPKLAYSIDEAVVASGLSRSLLYRAIKDGELTAIKAGSRTLVTTDGLRAFLSSLPAIYQEKQKPRAT